MFRPVFCSRAFPPRGAGRAVLNLVDAGGARIITTISDCHAGHAHIQGNISLAPPTRRLVQRTHTNAGPPRASRCADSGAPLVAHRRHARLELEQIRISARAQHGAPRRTGLGGQPSHGRGGGDPVRKEGRKKSGQWARLAGRVGASDVLVSDGGSRAGASCGGGAHRWVLRSSPTKTPATSARGRWPTMIGSTSLRAERFPPSRSAARPSSAPPPRELRARWPGM